MSKPESGPEELYANLIPGPFAPFVCYTSETQAKVYGDLAGLETRLVGVDPDWRERAMRAEAEAERLRIENHDLRNQLNAAAIEAATTEGGTE